MALDTARRGTSAIKWVVNELQRAVEELNFALVG